ncbi:hypothetical protein H0266_18490 [Halobacillus locisalis]|uniref:TRASH domain-containing protein n=1 Tax=Halobacillus locisalis TaxID=220753 RepID=A0A838CXK1_9BACI|nr:hypothetical protein [Halobacillus locisalis]MBA2176872.1 hypothetical protein [Halobacillus locisalis]
MNRDLEHPDISKVGYEREDLPQVFTKCEGCEEDILSGREYVLIHDEVFCSKECLLGFISDNIEFIGARYRN